MPFNGIRNVSREVVIERRPVMPPKAPPPAPKPAPPRRQKTEEERQAAKARQEEEGRLALAKKAKRAKRHAKWRRDYLAGSIAYHEKLLQLLDASGPDALRARIVEHIAEVAAQLAEAEAGLAPVTPPKDLQT